MAAPRQTLRIYQTKNGKRPFADWFDRLRDPRAQQRIDARLARVEAGNFGDCRAVGQGVSELRIDYGPGYRVYFGRDGHEIVILLCGGDKRTQSRDIASAEDHWADYQVRKKAPSDGTD